MKISPADIGSSILSAVGVPVQPARRLAPWAFVFALLLALAATWGLFRVGWAVFDWWNDRAAIEDATGKANAEFRERQLEAERKAGDAKDTRDAADAAAQRDLEKELDDADKAGSSGADAVWNGGLWADPAD